MRRESLIFRHVGEVPKGLGPNEEQACRRVLLFIHALGFLIERENRDTATLLTLAEAHRLFPKFASMMKWEGEMYTLDTEGRCLAVSIYSCGADKSEDSEYCVQPFTSFASAQKNEIEGLAKQRLIEAGEEVLKLWLP